ncbi:hypothetical protein LXL04_012529 [Taraxacum kok-saghyz]
MSTAKEPERSKNEEMAHNKLVKGLGYGENQETVESDGDGEVGVQCRWETRTIDTKQVTLSFPFFSNTELKTNKGSRSGEKEKFGENHERVDGELTDFGDLEDRTKKSRVRASENLLSIQQEGESVELSTRAMMAGDSCSFRPPASASSLPSFCRCERSTPRSKTQQLAPRFQLRPKNL